MKKCSFVSAFLAIVMLFCISSSAFAKEPTIAASEVMSEGNDTFATAYIDLSRRIKQEVSTVLPNGETVVCGAEPVLRPSFREETYENAFGTWRIYWTGVYLNIEYYIDISKDGKITDAYDQSHSTVGCAVSSSGLSHSSTKATGWWDWDIQGLTGKRAYLYASMSGTTLTTWAKT